MGNIRGFLAILPGSGDFSPHGFCYLWNPKLMWLHIVSDLAIAAAYFTIPVTLLWLARKRREVSFGWIACLFGLFIVACGFTHVLEVWNLWHTDYWVEGAVKAVTAVASVGTAIVLARTAPKLADLPSADMWIRANAVLESETNERRETEVLLRQQEAHYRDLAELVDLTHDAIFVRTLDSRILFWNTAAEKLYGWTKDEVSGQITHDLLHTTSSAPVEEIVREVMEKGAWEGELVHTCKDGTKRVVSSRWALRTDGHGNPISVLESNRDITAKQKEDRRFRALLESAPDAMVIVNGAGEIQLVNARAEEVFGYTRAEMLGQPVEMIVPERFRGNHAHHRDTYAEHPVSRAMGENVDLYARRKDGTEFPVEVSLSPLETSDGTFISSAIRDVTERRRIQQDLRDANEFLEQRVQARTQELAEANAGLQKSQSSMMLAQKVARIGTFEVEGNPPRSIWTPGMEAIYGLKEGEYTGTRDHWVSLVHPDDRERALNVVETAMATHSSYSNEYRIVRSDGAVRWIRAHGQLFYGQQGEFRRLVGVNLDITDAKNKESEIIALNTGLERRVDERTQELTAANKELESFSYSVSHDLRAPLRHIDGFARILSEEFAAELPEDARNYLNRILKSTSDMGRLIDSLIKLAHLGRQELACEQVELGALVKSAIADLPQTESERNIEWRLETLPTVDCDPDLLKAVLTNLLSNALKFTRGRPVSIIDVGSTAVKGELAFFVKDNGVGFDPKYADKLFGVFQRLHAQEKFEGTGIGLATVQRIVQRHGGKIWAESTPDQGATFFFTLNIGRATPASLNSSEPALVSAGPQ
jgi:PAS domain S-box-containing protein